MNKYILKDKRPVRVDEVREWGRWFETANRQVASDSVGDSNISTVFLGIDLDWTGERPTLFETMVFGGSLDGQQEHYSTWEEAEEGHKRMVEKIRSKEF